MESPKERHERGAAMADKMAVTNGDLGDLAYLRGIEAAMNQADLEEFQELLFSEQCRGVAGIRGAADLAVRKLREKAAGRIAGGVVAKGWRAGT